VAKRRHAADTNREQAIKIETQYPQKMNINITYYLDEYGWSTCCVYANGKLCEISITHVFPPDPIEECLNALIGIMKGEPERRFNWYSEPSGKQITISEIPTKKHMINFQLDGFDEDYGEEIGDLEKEIEFEIMKKQLVRMFYFEFKKISELLRDKHYEENRKNVFSFHKFREFEKIATEYIELK